MAIARPADPDAFSAPVTFELDAEAYELLQMQRAQFGVGSISEVVREALLQFDFSQFNQRRHEKRQLSVRISPELKNTLLETARKANVSQAVLLRAALEQLRSAAPRTIPTETNMATKKTTAKKAVKKAAKKAPAKKAVKKAVAKKAVKTAVKKTAAKKAAVKKTAAKKTTAVKAVKKAVKKTATKAVKKTAAKKAVKKAPAKKAAKKAARKKA